MTDTNKVIPNLAKAALKNANGTEKCVICDRELPVDMTQVLLDLKGSSACLQHEGSKELYKWRIKHQKHEIEALQRENERLQAQTARMREALEAILREFDDFGNRRDGLRAFEALRMAKTSLSDTPTEYHNPADVEEIERLKEQVDTLSATVNMLAPTEIGKECRHIEALRKARETLEFYASKRKYITV